MSEEEGGIDVLRESRESEAKEPAVTASSASLEKVKVKFFAFDGAFGTGTCVGMKLPEGRVSGNASV